MKSVLTSLALVCSTLTLSAAEPPAVGQALPKLAELLPGAKLPATTGKVVLVDFWASWCDTISHFTREKPANFI